MSLLQPSSAAPCGGLLSLPCLLRAPWVGVAFLALAGCKGEEPKSDAPTAPTAAPTFRQIEPDLPPPEPEPEPDAGGDEADAGSSSSGGSAVRSSGCEAKVCADAPSSALLGALTQRGRQARRCYEAQLANDPSLSVKMSVNVKIGTQGNVCGASVVESTNDAVARCVLSSFRGGGYPASKGCVANVTVPLNYVPR